MSGVCTCVCESVGFCMCVACECVFCCCGFSGMWCVVLCCVFVFEFNLVCVFRVLCVYV